MKARSAVLSVFLFFVFCFLFFVFFLKKKENMFNDFLPHGDSTCYITAFLARIKV